MAHTNSTSNYSLSQFIGTDKPTFLGDYNGDMLKIDAAIKGAADDASGAVTTANAASALATDAASTATSAASDASAASATATTALNTANNATTTAQSASTTATSAATDAANAVTTANSAMSAATGAATASGTSYDNTTSGLVANTVQSAIDELAQGSPASEHGLYELWNNPNPTSDYANTPILINDFDTSKYDSIEIEWAIDKNEARGNTVERFEVAAFASASLAARKDEMIISSNILVMFERQVVIGMSSNQLQINFGHCNQYSFATYGSAPTATQTDGSLIPVRVLGLAHNS